MGSRRLSTRPVRSVEGVFWSPDGGWLLHTDGVKLSLAALKGGNPTVLGTFVPWAVINEAR